MEENKTPATEPQRIIIENRNTSPKNGIGIAGFVLSLIGFFFFWMPVLNYIVWILGLVFSFIGVFKQPRGLSIAGLCISLVGLLLIIIFTLGVFAAAVKRPVIIFE